MISVGKQREMLRNFKNVAPKRMNHNFHWKFPIPQSSLTLMFCVESDVDTKEFLSKHAFVVVVCSCDFSVHVKNEERMKDIDDV